MRCAFYFQITDNHPEPLSEDMKQQNKNEAPDGNRVTLCPLDYATPLTIQTSPAPSTSGTDTPSDIGSAFNSPTQSWNWPNSSVFQNSPNSSNFKRFVVLRMGEQDDKENDRNKMKNGKLLVISLTILLIFCYHRFFYFALTLFSLFL